jgi:hypothetical protein
MIEILSIDTHINPTTFESTQAVTYKNDGKLMTRVYKTQDKSGLTRKLVEILTNGLEQPEEKPDNKVISLKDYRLKHD